PRQIDHAHRHAAGGPAVALVEVGRAGLAGEAKLIGLLRAGGESPLGAEIPVVVVAGAVAGVEGGGIGGVHGVVALHRAGVHGNPLVAHPHLGEPAAVPAGLPFTVQPVAVAL